MELYGSGKVQKRYIRRNDLVYADNKVVTTREGYTYDKFRNVLTDKSSKAYLAKNKGKEHLYTTTYIYQGTGSGYSAGDAAMTCPLITEESYSGANTKNKLVSTVAANGIDYASISEQRSLGGGAYKTISKTDFQYDDQGNETQGKVYPSYSTDGEKEVIQNDYTYNSLGQQIRKTVTITSAKRPSDNRTYTEEEVSYDSFGNELTIRMKTVWYQRLPMIRRLGKKPKPSMMRY